MMRGVHRNHRFLYRGLTAATTTLTMYNKRRRYSNVSTEVTHAKEKKKLCK